MKAPVFGNLTAGILRVEELKRLSRHHMGTIFYDSAVAKEKPYHILPAEPIALISFVARKGESLKVSFLGLPKFFDDPRMELPCSGVLRVSRES